MSDDPYSDPRLVALYDEDNPDGPDHDYYRALADELGATTIVDLGCGTGLLTVTLARPGRIVVGLDPSAAMLAVARGRSGGENVQWLQGDSTALTATGADLAIMTGNVAQHVLGDAWPRTLRDLHDALRPGGMIAFESRNPSARAWESWSGERATRRTPGGPLTEWMQLTEATDDEVAFAAHNVFERSGEHLVVELRLAFRSAELLCDQLAAAGFGDVTMMGGWDGGPLDDTSRLIVTRAIRLAA